MDPAFARVETWIFDLDETLYPPATPLFPQIERRMTDWIARFLGLPGTEADAMRRGWWESHGTSLAGLVADHGIDPRDFLAHVHDVDLSGLAPDPALRDAVAALPGRRVVHTNGPRDYALRVLAARGLDGPWDAVYGIDQTRHASKPHAAAYDAVRDADGHDPARAAMFEDTARNLIVPHARGTVTVHVSAAPAADAHVDHATADLTGFLRDVLRPGR